MISERAALRDRPPENKHAPLAATEDKLMQQANRNAFGFRTRLLKVLIYDRDKKSTTATGL